ncbi:MAG: glycosyltransferase [Cytophagales bacterium]|nr:glycosyltransferase [Cytophagales bacterium]
MSVSLIIPTYNRDALLRTTLQSVVEQNLSDLTLEVIVADDGSSDRTKEVIAEYKERLELNYLFQENRGFRVASARNMAIKEAKNELCVFIDAGMVIAPDFVKSHYQAHQGSPEAITTIGYMYGTEPDDLYFREQLKAQFFDLVKGTAKETFELFRTSGQFYDAREQDYQSCQDELNGLPAPWVLYWTCNVAARRELLLELGGFDTNYDGCWGMEDVDLGYHMYSKGVGFKLVRGAEGLHIPHKKNPKEREVQEMRNKQYFYEKFPAYETELLLHCGTHELNDKLVTNTSTVPI